MKLTVEQVKEAIEDAGLKPREYSGRGMYGEHCLGVDVPRNMVSGLIGIAMNLIKNGAEPKDVEEWGQGTDFDSMGMGMVLYWPRLKLTEEQVQAFIDEDEAEAQ